MELTREEADLIYRILALPDPETFGIVYDNHIIKGPEILLQKRDDAETAFNLVVKLKRWIEQ